MHPGEHLGFSSGGEESHGRTLSGLVAAASSGKSRVGRRSRSATGGLLGWIESVAEEVGRTRCTFGRWSLEASPTEWKS